MQLLSSNPNAVYRRIDLDARIEASTNGDLTRICLEEVVSALGQAALAMERAPDAAPRDAIGRAHCIALWLARSVAPDNPMQQQLVQFYGGLAALIARNLARPEHSQLCQARDDFRDVLLAVQQG
ncbi:hypothetical protein FGU71_03750 [Erythrobacter insulae]|uniref:Flagellin n=1 Tax=Erythrobacter insulae TaxID=2584124 RepID=A0A547PA80_9SPHN|nr:hypothetical protein [Erythrobacter insulae]TRD11051.1 hypothetical protein FGU71_03750 [Erythrobacter insulae]